MKVWKCAKRTLSFVSVLAILLTSLLIGGISASAASFVINGRSYTYNVGQCIGGHRSAGCIVGVGQTTWSNSNHNSGHYCCYNNACDLYSTYWGQNHAHPRDNFLDVVPSTPNTAENMKKWLSVAEPGSLVTIGNTYQSHDGHTVIFLGVADNDHIYIVNTNGHGTGLNPVECVGWDYLPSYLNYSYSKIICISWPGAGSQYNARMNPATPPAPPPPPPSVSTGNASAVTNYTAKITAGVSNGTASSYGFYFGQSEGALSYKSGLSGSATMDVATYITATFGQLKANTTYYYKAFAVVGGKEVVSSTVKNFTTTNIKPSVVTPKVSVQDIAIDDAIQVTWPEATDATYYEAYLYNEGGDLLETNDAITGTSTAFVGRSESGTYYVGLKAFNNAGSAGESARIKVVVHDNVTVDFVDFDGTKLCESQVIGYGKSATAPADPARKGYTFDSWDKEFSEVTEDTTVTATYEINVYTVRFYDNSGKMIGAPQQVEYQSAAEAPEYSPADGYKLFGWDKEFDCIEEDTDVTANIDWYNENFDVFAKLVTAERITEGTSNEGYDVTVNVINNEDTTTRGRIVVALQTSEGNLVEMTESAAFTVKASDTKEVNVFVPSDKVATKVTAYVVSSYSNIIPIAEPVSIEIDQSNAFTEWSTEEPPEDAYKTETKTEYAYSTKSTTTSEDTNLSGWTQSGSAWVETGSGTTDYITNWPSGFSTSHPIYGQYAKSAPYAYETATEKRTVSTSTVGYMYYHWCRGDGAGAYANRMISYGYTPEFHAFHAFISSGAIGYNGSADAFDSPQPSVCNSSKWWNSANPNSVPVYRASYTDYKKEFAYYKWSEYSDWSTTPKEADENTKVKTRTVYRYRTNESAAENLEGEEHTISGNVGEENAGKKAALYIYKVNSASDFTNEFIGQTTIDENGEYSFTFKLREEPSAETGDFTVELGLEGASTGIYLDPMPAPKKTYTVNFFNKDGEVISTQTIEEGEDAELPEDEAMEEEGYRFLNWTESNRNIREDLDIYPNYECQEFTVVFVDWSSRSVEMAKYKYGEMLTLPLLGEAEEDEEIKWDCEEGTLVKDDMIVTTVIEQKEVTATIMDVDDTVKEVDSIPYGTAVTLPSLDFGDKILLGWKIQQTDDSQAYDLNDSVLTSNVVIYPDYKYEETVNVPQCNLAESEYTEEQVVELVTEEEGAQIYYTTDGTNPLESDTAMLYTDKITLKNSCEFQYAAKKEGMNDSEVARRLYAINASGNKKYHILYASVYHDGMAYADYTISNLIEDGATISDLHFDTMCEGYDLLGLYYDEEKHSQFDVESEKINASITLFGFYAPKTFDVIFKDEDGTIYKADRVTYKQSATPPVPTNKPGYVFVGWNTDEYLEVTKDLIVTALFISDTQFESQYATVRFEDEDGTLYKEEVVEVGQSATPPTVSKEGFTFTGWDTDAYLNVEADLVVKAQFVKVEPVITVVIGDINNDDAVNTKDVLALRKFLAGIDIEVFDSAAADTNGDGAVNMKDVLMLRMFIAGLIDTFDA